MNSGSQNTNSHQIVVKGGLENLTRRLSPGEKVPARIVDCLGHSTYILRVRGYNMISESQFPFSRFDEVELEVEAVDPRLIFNLNPLKQSDPMGIFV